MNMSNEELASRIKAGDDSLQETLWLQVKRFIVKMAQSYILRSKDACMYAGLELDDFIQAGYLAMMDAVKAFPEEDAPYKFITYLNRPLKNQFNALTGLKNRAEKSKKVQQELTLFENARRLDQEIAPHSGKESEATLSDFIPDPEAEAAFERIEESDYLEKLGSDLQAALATLPAKQARCITMFYYDDQTQAYIADVLKLSPAYVESLIHSGLLSMRRCVALKNYREQQFNRVYKRVNWRNWTSGRSIVENIVMKVDAKERGLAQFLDYMTSFYTGESMTTPEIEALMRSAVRGNTLVHAIDNAGVEYEGPACDFQKKDEDALGFASICIQDPTHNKDLNRLTWPRVYAKDLKRLDLVNTIKRQGASALSLLSPESYELHI